MILWTKNLVAQNGEMVAANERKIMKMKCAKCRKEYDSEFYPCACPDCYPLKPHDLIVGDEFYARGDKQVSSTGGKVIKVNRTTLVYETLYMGRIPQTIKIEKTNIRGALKIKRNGVIL